MTVHNLFPCIGPKLLLALVLLFLSDTLLAQGKIDSSEMVTLRIDPENATGANVSQLFDEVRFIPLETTKESLFGRIDGMRVIKGKFVIWDNDTRAILIFGGNGKFLSKLNARNIQDEETETEKSAGNRGIWGFSLFPENGDTLIAVRGSKNYFLFDTDGRKVKKVAARDYQDLNDYRFQDKLTSLRTFYSFAKDKDSIRQEFALIRNKDTVGYFPFPANRYEKDEFWDGSSVYNSGIDNEVFFHLLYSNNIFRIRPSGVFLAYRVIFPAANSLPADFFTNPAYIRKRGQYFERNPKTFFGMNSIYQFGDFLYMQMRSFSWNKGQKKAIIYNLKTSELFSVQDLKPDSLSFYLPVTDAGAFYDFQNNGFWFSDNCLYTSYSSLAMFNFKEQLGDKNKVFPAVLQEYFKTENKKSNPVLIQLKPKKQ